MKAAVTTSRFKRDYRRTIGRGMEMEKLDAIMLDLLHERPLAAKLRDHPLRGGYRGRRECHVAPDWLLVYKLEEDAVIFERTGSHSDLFE